MIARRDPRAGHRVAVFVVAWMLGFLTASVASPQAPKGQRGLAKASAEELDQAALSAIGEGHYQEAERLFKELLRRSPSDARTLYNLACCYSRQTELKLAAEFLEASWRAGLRDPERLRDDPDLAALRESGRGKRLISRLTAEAEKMRRRRGQPLQFEAPVLGRLQIVMPEPVDPDQRYPLLLVLHGHGGSGEYLAGFLEVAKRAPEVIGVAPFGPYPVALAQGHGYSWYPPAELFRELLELAAAGDDTARAEQRLELGTREQETGQRYVLAALETVAENYPVDRDRVFLLGFSEGGVMAYSLGLAHPELFRGLVIIGSRLREEDADPSRLAAAADQLQVLVCHSPADRAISFAKGEEAHSVLRAAGIKSRLVSYPGGHTINAGLINTVASWLSKRIREPAPDRNATAVTD